MLHQRPVARERPQERERLLDTGSLGQHLGADVVDALRIGRYGSVDRNQRPELLNNRAATYLHRADLDNRVTTWVQPGRFDVHADKGHLLERCGERNHRLKLG